MMNVDESSPVEELVARALDGLEGGNRRTRPVSVSIPEPLLEAVQRLVADGSVSSASAAVTEALAGWLRNQMLRLQLDEIFAEHPDLRPTDEEIQETLAALGLGRSGGAAA